MAPEIRHQSPLVYYVLEVITVERIAGGLIFLALLVKSERAIKWMQHVSIKEENRQVLFSVLHSNVQHNKHWREIQGRIRRLVFKTRNDVFLFKNVDVP